MGNFSGALETEEFVINGTVGLRVVNGNLEIKLVSQDPGGKGYTISGDALISGLRLSETKRAGYTYSPFVEGVVINNTSFVDDGNFKLAKWSANDSKSYNFKVPNDYKVGTLMHPVIFWRNLTSNPDITKKVQFDIKYKTVSESAMSAESTMSLVDGPLSMLLRTLVCNSVQAISSVQLGDIVEIVTTRVKPTVGSDYGGQVVVHSIGMLYQSDVILTKELTTPYTKANL